MKRTIYAAYAVLNFLVSSVLNAQPYTPTWSSVDRHPPAPEWFKDAKFGIYFHWGVYSVPAFSKEWYPNEIYDRNTASYTHHVATYGDPFSNWPYHNFINGANDKSGKFVQFAPKLVSAGGKFDPAAWAQLFYDAGAKFAGPVAEHHDGFSMWNSQVNEWNAFNKGPKLDLAGLLGKEIRAKGMKYIMSSHSAMQYNGYFANVPRQTDPSLQKLYGQLPKAKSDTLWFLKLKEMIDKYQPDIIWHDWYLNSVAEQQRLNFLAYYYNAALDSNKEVVVTYKEYDGGFHKNGCVADYERGGPADIVNPYWLTDESISSSSWCYTEGIGYYSSKPMLHSFLDRISKNGSVLLNIAPMADGTIPQGQKDILLAMGDWLKKFGEAVYATRAWTVYGEGPTKMGGGSFVTPTAGNSQDFRFTRTKDSTTLYAIELGWPGNGVKKTITSITPARFTVKGVYLLGNTPGTYIDLGAFTQNAQGLTFTLPATQPYTASAYAFMITSPQSVAVSGSVLVASKPCGFKTKKLVCGSVITNKAMQFPKNATGLEVYSLQGKKVFSYRVNNGEKGIPGGLKISITPGVYYIKVLTRQ